MLCFACPLYPLMCMLTPSLRASLGNTCINSQWFSRLLLIVARSQYGKDGLSTWLEGMANECAKDPKPSWVFHDHGTRKNSLSTFPFPVALFFFFFFPLAPLLHEEAAQNLFWILPLADGTIPIHMAGRAQRFCQNCLWIHLVSLNCCFWQCSATSFPSVQSFPFSFFSWRNLFPAVLHCNEPFLFRLPDDKILPSDVQQH